MGGRSGDGLLLSCGFSAPSPSPSPPPALITSATPIISINLPLCNRSFGTEISGISAEAPVPQLLLLVPRPSPDKEYSLFYQKEGITCREGTSGEDESYLSVGASVCVCVRERWKEVDITKGRLFIFFWVQGMRHWELKNGSMMSAKSYVISIKL